MRTDEISVQLRESDTHNLAQLVQGFEQGAVSLVACNLRGRPVPVICVLCDGDTLGRTPSYVPFAILINEYTTDLLNDLVPPPSLHGEWRWSHVPQKDPPPPLAPPEGDSSKAGEPA